MGQCYSVNVNVKLKDEAGAIKALQNKIATDKRTNYSLDEYAAQGIGTETFDDLMRIFLAGWKGQEVSIDENGYHNDFNASYGWESVMVEMFHVIAPYCKDGSEIRIYPDHGSVVYGVRNGKALEVTEYIVDAEDSPIEDYEAFDTEKECLDWLEKKTGFRMSIKEWESIFNDEDVMVEVLGPGPEWEGAYVEFQC